MPLLVEYDSWAVINIAKEFEEAKKHMSDQEVSII
jgi:hypothetical protein